MIDESGGYRCENCQRNYEEAVPTYNFSIKISDASGAMTASILGEMGDHIMEMPCKQFYDIHQDLEALKNLRSSQCFKHFNVTLRAKADSRMGSSQDDSGIRYTVIRVTPHSFQKENTELLKMLSAYEQQVDVM